MRSKRRWKALALGGVIVGLGVWWAAWGAGWTQFTIPGMGGQVQLGGLYAAKVIDTADPEAFGRVRIEFPTFRNDPNIWAYVVGQYTGEDYGAYFYPQVGDVVVFGFLGGDIKSPIVLGPSWPKGSKKYPDGEQIRFKTKGGHELLLDNSPGHQRVVVSEVNGAQLVLDSDGNAVTLKSPLGTITLDSATGLTIQSVGQVTIKGAVITLDAPVVTAGGKPIAP